MNKTEVMAALTLAGPLVCDLLKALLPLAVAWLIARQTVSWALARFKAEKAWERKLAAYADLVSSITRMRTIVGKLILETSSAGLVPEPIWLDSAQDYAAARARLEDAIALATLLAPNEFIGILNRLWTFAKLEPRRPIQAAEIGMQWDLLSEALESAIASARATVDLEP
jgi:hypothetical protein